MFLSSTSAPIENLADIHDTIVSTMLNPFSLDDLQKCRAYEMIFGQLVKRQLTLEEFRDIEDETIRNFVVKTARKLKLLESHTFFFKFVGTNGNVEQILSTLNTVSQSCGGEFELVIQEKLDEKFINDDVERNVRRGRAEGRMYHRGGF